MAEIAFVVACDYEDSELEVPRDRLLAAGHRVTIVGARSGERVHGKRGGAVVVDLAAAAADPDAFAGVVVPGGWSPDRLRTVPAVVDLVRRLGRQGRLVAAVCHGPSLLIDADLVAGRRVTSWSSIRRDLENAGAVWADEAVVADGNLVTSRKPDDLDAFTSTILERLEGEP